MVNIFNDTDLRQLQSDPFRAFRQPVSRAEVLSNGCIIYGAGAEGRLVLSCLKEAGISPLCFVDRNPCLQDTRIDGLQVRPAAELPYHPDCVVIIASCRVRSIVTDNPLLAGHRKVVVWSAINSFCPVLPEMPETIDVFFEDKSVAQAYALMADETSRTIFKNFIKFHINFDEALFADHDLECYFPAGLSVNHSRFVDAGAANGDTLTSWLKHGFPKSQDDCYYAFEPNRLEFAQLKSFAAELPDDVRDRVKLYEAGLGTKNTTLHLSEAGKSSRCAGHAAYEKHSGHVNKVNIVRLDDVLNEARPTLIKADVEGAELALLDGARETIRRWTPDLVISVYHRYSDLWRIPLWIKQQNGRYNIFLRHHTWAYDDVVCYALQ